jgi:hypothetical protein
VHLFRRFEIVIGVPFASLAEFVDRDVVTDAGNDVLQDAVAARLASSKSRS